MTIVEVKKLLPSDTEKLKELLLLFRDVFEQPAFSMPADAHLQKMLTNPQHLVFTAWLQGTLAGGATAYVLPEFETEHSLVYIYDLAVKTDLQRRGIGRQLIAGVEAYCRIQGFVELFVQADAADDYAVDFYRKTGGEEMKVVQFSYRFPSALPDEAGGGKMSGQKKEGEDFVASST